MEEEVKRTQPAERHRSGRSGWLRAAVLGADDGIVSAASLMFGIPAAAASQRAVLVADVAGLATRVLPGGLLAMGIAALVGRLFGVVAA